ncbi:MAG: sigma-70 family RNA polymerase sigma factor [Elusimicrobiota bacterium]|jgi:RNA polymerase sigma-70 factor (ECF subfamily)|nr:sigma-70 family RNA polymerase sigma factor [Elusimicrobiota bacterium]
MDKKLTDAQLVSRFKNGDSKAFEEIVLRYQAHVYTYILSIVKNPDTASDICQDLFVKIFRTLHKYNEENKLKNWLFTLARNLTMDYFRKNSKRLVPLENQDEDEFSLLDTISDNSPSPLKVLIENAQKEAINDALGKLSMDERELVALKDNFTFAEIAAMQKKPIGTLLSKFSRTLKKLRRILAQRSPEVYNEYLQ